MTAGLKTTIPENRKVQADRRISEASQQVDQLSFGYPQDHYDFQDILRRCGGA